MRRPRNAPGFSLVELLIAMAVSLLVIAGAMALLVSQQRIFQVSSADRALQETGRIALEELTSNLRMAGYGIDPDYAFDFGPQPTTRQDRAPATADLSAASTFPGCTAISCRDSIAGSDEIVFRYRNPSFVRSLAAAPTGGTSITIAGPLRAPLYQGQILQVMCFAGDMLWAYVTVGSTVGITNDDTVTINLAAGNGDEFPFQNAYLTNGCFSAVAPRNANATTFAAASKVYKVDQFRYFLARYDEAGTVVTDITTTARPYLMLDQGLLDGGNPILNVVAPNVEDLQFAYVFPNSAAANQLIGATVSSPISAGGSGIDLDPGCDPSRVLRRDRVRPATHPAPREHPRGGGQHRGSLPGAGRPGVRFGDPGGRQSPHAHRPDRIPAADVPDHRGHPQPGCSRPVLPHLFHFHHPRRRLPERRRRLGRLDVSHP